MNLTTKQEIREREKEKMAQPVANSPAGLIYPAANMKRRQTAIYIRPDTEPDGTPRETRPLPCDPESRASYEAKGFRIKGAPDTRKIIQDNQELEAKVTSQEEEIALLKAELEARNTDETKPRRGRPPANSE